MPSPFDAIDASMQAVIDRSFGGGITVRPQAAGNYTGGADPARPARAGVRATIARAPAIGTTDFNNSNRNGAARTTAASEVWIDRAAYAALGYRLKRDDIVELSEEGTPPPSFKIAAVHDGDHGDVQIILAG